MKKYILLILLVLGGCSTVQIERYQQEFDKMLSGPMTEQQRAQMESKLKRAKQQLKTTKKNITPEQRAQIDKQIDYYLRVLQDLKD